MRILVIEDESKLADYLHKGLSEQNYVVDVARNNYDGLHAALEGCFDLIVLDVMLPGIDGFGVLAQLRRIKDTPVLMLTARDKIEDRVQGLLGGVDDYLVKPCVLRIVGANSSFIASRAQPRIHAIDFGRSGNGSGAAQGLSGQCAP
jgi:DNA-binding response OmpR family regulator